MSGNDLIEISQSALSLIVLGSTLFGAGIALWASRGNDDWPRT